jgi:intracellular multiplication protein IcmE
MTHNPPDDFDDDFQDAQVTPEPAKKPGMARNLASAWNGSPLFKLFVLVVGVGALAAMVIGLLSGGNKGERAGVSVGGVPGVSSTPGDQAPPAYVDAVNDASKKRTDAAIINQTSAIPTPVSGDVTTAGLGPDDKESQYDPLAEFRPNIPPDNTVTQSPNQEPVEIIDSDLLAKMQQQMTSLFDAWRPQGIHLVQVTDPASLIHADPNQGQQVQQNARVLLAAGSVHYAQLLVEANSDVPGPILAEVMSGPFTGARVIGQFQVTRDYLILHFTKLTYHRKDYGIDAIALDPNTTLGGLVTEKDNRYFSRLILPAAAGFLEGFGSALSSSGSTTSVTGNGVVVVENARQGVKEGLYRGLSDTATTAGNFFREEASNIKPLIRVATGTPMGLFFVNSMTDGNNGQPVNTPSFPGNEQPAGPPMPVNNNVNPFGGSNATIGGVSTVTQQPGVTVINPNNSNGLANSGVNIIQSRTR